MADPHRALGRFFDGELPESEVDGFRTHLATCKRCQAELEELMQLDVLGTRHLQIQALKSPKVVQLKPAPRPPWLRWGSTVGLAVAATLVATVALWPRGPSRDLWQPAGPEVRLAEARSSYPAASQYHRQQNVLGPDTRALRPLSDLSKVGDDPLAVASFLLARNDPGLVKQALDQLALVPAPDASSDSEHAMAYLIRGDAEAADFEQALRFAEKALKANPKHGPALWNKALALQGLGLSLLAAKTFDQVAQLGEPGWASEARNRAERLRAEAAHLREAWNAAREAALALEKSGSSLPDVALNAPISRQMFFHAVRTRTSSADVVTLLPVAEQLDQRSGGTFLQDYVRKIAGRDFKVRGPEAAKYRRLVVEGETGLIPELTRSPEHDIALGAMTFLDPRLDADQLKALEAHVAWVGDPWFEVVLVMKRAQEMEPRDSQAAIKLLEDARAKADSLRLQYRSMQVGAQLIEFQLRASDLSAASAAAAATWKSAETTRDWGMQVQIIQLLGQLARLRKDHDYPVAKAYLGEAIERNREEHQPEQELFNRQQLALLEVEALNMDAAREQLDAAIATGGELDSVGAGVLADVSRKRASPLDRQVIDRYRATLDKASPGDRALGKETVGRWTIEVNPEEGRKLLQDLIQEIGAHFDPDGDLARARSFAFSALLMDAAKRKDFAGFVALVEQEAGATFPATCAVALNLDMERGAVMVRGASGALDGDYDGNRAVSLPETLDGFVPERLLSGLRGCQQVKVVARPPLFGRLGALPNSIAWSYEMLGRPPAGPVQQGRHLVVQTPAESARVKRLQLGALHGFMSTHPAPSGVFALEGHEAVPSRILAELATAGDADLVMHGWVNPHSGEAFLLAAEEPGGGDTITATQIRATKLNGHPTVMLSACHGAHTPSMLYEARSLPAALLQAGARAVLAAHVDVPEDEGPRFFEAVRARIHEGTAPAVALRDVRQSWLSEGKVKNWVESVLIFE